jgi:hypothetical protein
MVLRMSAQTLVRRLAAIPTLVHIKFAGGDFTVAAVPSDDGDRVRELARSD